MYALPRLTLTPNNATHKSPGRTTYCADEVAGKSRDWKLAYPWVAYCAPYMGGMADAHCGKCMRMTNNRTGAKVIVRIMDQCGHGGAWGGSTTHMLGSGHRMHAPRAPPLVLLPPPTCLPT